MLLQPPMTQLQSLSILVLRNLLLTRNHLLLIKSREYFRVTSSKSQNSQSNICPEMIDVFYINA